MGEAIKRWQVWAEGYDCTGCEGAPSPAHKLGEAEEVSFDAACRKLLGGDKAFDANGPSYWGCRLFPTESEARERFG